MKFVIDAQLPPVMALWLRAAGHEADHLEEVGLLQADDATIWTHAARTGAAILTKDEDFAEKARMVGGPPTIIWLRIGNCSNAELKAWFEPRLAGVVQMCADRVWIIEVI